MVFDAPSSPKVSQIEPGAFDPYRSLTSPELLLSSVSLQHSVADPPNLVFPSTTGRIQIVATIRQ